MGRGWGLRGVGSLLALVREGFWCSAFVAEVLDGNEVLRQYTSSDVENIQRCFSPADQASCALTYET